MTDRKVYKYSSNQKGMGKRAYVRAHFRGGDESEPEPVVVKEYVYIEPEPNIEVVEVKGEPNATDW